jgi:hypothetical protein
MVSLEFLHHNEDVPELNFVVLNWFGVGIPEIDPSAAEEPTQRVGNSEGGSQDRRKVANSIGQRHRRQIHTAYINALRRHFGMPRGATHKDVLERGMSPVASSSYSIADVLLSYCADPNRA